MRQTDRKILQAYNRLRSHHGSDVPRMAPAKKRARRAELPADKDIVLPGETVDTERQRHLVDVLNLVGADMAGSAVEQISTIAPASVNMIDLEDVNKTKTGLWE